MSWYDIIKFASVTMKVYHGTGSMKSILDGGFSYEFSGRGNEQYGPGFYFTNNYETAKGYTTRRISPEVSKLGGVLLNVWLNWIFIYGHWGAPALGLVGAGGIGMVLDSAMNLFQWTRVAMVLAAIFAVVVVAEVIVTQVRKRVL